MVYKKITQWYDKHWKKGDDVKPLFVVVFLFIINISSVFAGRNCWTQLGGPEGGTIYSIAIYPPNSDILFIATDNSVYKSTNHGNSYFLTDLPTGTTFHALAIDAKNPATIFAASGILYKTMDSGTTWMQLSGWIPNQNNTSIKIDPTNSNIIYISRLGGVAKSIDAGDSWTICTTGMEYREIYALAIDPANPNILYAAANRYGVYKSVDSGSTWSFATTGLGWEKYVTCLEIDPQQPNIIYAGTSYGFYKSTDYATSWQLTTTGMGYHKIGAIAIDPNNTNIIYAGTWYGDGMFKSLNRGDTWIEINNGLKNIDNSLNGFYIYCLAIDPNNTDIIYAGLNFGYGIYRSTTAGASWVKTIRGICNHLVNDIEIDPNNPLILYVGTSQGNAYDEFGVYKSVDSGTNWYWKGTGLPKIDVRRLAINPNNSNIVFAGMIGVYRSLDAAISWTLESTGMGDVSIRCLAINSVDANIIYAGTQSDYFFKSIDNGVTWFQSTTGLEHNVILSIATHPLNVNEVYLGSAGIYKSIDQGSLWIKCTTGSDIKLFYSIAISPSNPNILFASTLEKVYKSINAGLTWSSVTEIGGVGSIIIDPMNSNSIYLGSFDSGVFRSLDGGLTWESMNQGLKNINVTDLAFSPTEPPILYAGTWGNSVWAYTIVPTEVELLDWCLYE